MDSIPKYVLVGIGAHRVLVSGSKPFEEVGSLVAWGCNWADRKTFLCSVCQQVDKERVYVKYLHTGT